MTIAGLDHFTILTDDVARTVAFYGHAVGLLPGPRPPFDFPGAWLYAGKAPVLHVIGGRARTELVPGAIDHVAFAATGLAATVGRLAARGIAHDLRRLPDDGRWQLFFRDPNGVRVELVFAADEPAS